MIVRCTVSVRVDGVLLQRYPIVRRIEDVNVDAEIQTVLGSGATAEIVPNSVAKRVRSVRVHAPTTLDLYSLHLDDGLFLVFDENEQYAMNATNDGPIPAPLETYRAE